MDSRNSGNVGEVGSVRRDSLGCLSVWAGVVLSFDSRTRSGKARKGFGTNLVSVFESQKGWGVQGSRV